MSWVRPPSAFWVFQGARGTERPGKPRPWALGPGGAEAGHPQVESRVESELGS